MPQDSSPRTEHDGHTRLVRDTHRKRSQEAPEMFETTFFRIPVTAKQKNSHWK